MFELYKRFLGVEPANKLKRLKEKKRTFLAWANAKCTNLRVRLDTIYFVKN